MCMCCLRMDSSSFCWRHLQHSDYLGPSYSAVLQQKQYSSIHTDLRVLETGVTPMSRMILCFMFDSGGFLESKQCPSNKLNLFLDSRYGLFLNLLISAVYTKRWFPRFRRKLAAVSGQVLDLPLPRMPHTSSEKSAIFMRAIKGTLSLTNQEVWPTTVSTTVDVDRDTKGIPRTFLKYRHSKGDKYRELAVLNLWM